MFKVGKAAAGTAAVVSFLLAPVSAPAQAADSALTHSIEHTCVGMTVTIANNGDSPLQVQIGRYGHEFGGVELATLAPRQRRTLKIGRGTETRTTLSYSTAGTTQIVMDASWTPPQSCPFVSAPAAISWISKVRNGRVNRAVSLIATSPSGTQLGFRIGRSPVQWRPATLAANSPATISLPEVSNRGAVCVRLWARFGAKQLKAMPVGDPHCFKAA